MYVVVVRVRSTTAEGVLRGQKSASKVLVCMFVLDVVCIAEVAWHVSVELGI